ncbi:TetR/AcrR family transcriptional regulator [Streptomyces spectabilis]|uniref:AcrR family transcriptional regulator n=1 Tax=Streptomyces spectabilis TaxID=68270 RepID=A0A5P2XHF0_STRST|nr:TetR/AcrR family transcriptional regulator [Streptomyces spectabilis]MBB5102642.1 AcrR family transcriptional regulator [Streptomyces spectabilis]MCI3907679.1 TetR/AcrR family transcriptional regulator [Streptomyces spectabilis]QEV64353.1 TetR/AcrR family transcriptional regulator [Streptomyces spectabilis]GGV30632.1 TetR family transcriptional regulator [Streptomyces spectabilis]
MTASKENQTARRRAPGMSPEQRREMIIQTAIPLIAEYGAAVTTAKIARAAGIGEGTIFRVFADKDELLQACVAKALSPEHAVRELDAIDVSQPLPDRLAEAAEALQAHLARMGAILGALGHRGGKHPGSVRGAGRDESTTRIRAALAELLEPDRASLRRPPEQIAALFFGLLFTQPRTEDEPDLTAQELAEVFLYGALSGDAA